MELSDLNERQREAVTHNDTALAVLSSAGSGKTRTIVTKIKYLVNDLKVNPRRIWACTFTNKAAGEMKDRLKPILGDEIVSKLKMGTLHSMAYKILKQGKGANDPYFRMPKLLTKNYALLNHLYTFCKEGDFINKDAKAYIQIIGNSKLDLVKPNQFLSFNKPQNGNICAKTDFNIACYEVYKEYEKWMKKHNFMDFTDMLVNCYYMLIDPKYDAFVSNLQDRCEYILVDEAQDTNTVSFKIIDILATKWKRVTIVGDTRQLIYSFQGARMSNIHNFIKKYKPKLVDLNTNYRSTRVIVDNANTLISYGKDIIGEPAITPNEEGEKIGFMTSRDVPHEAERIVELVDEIKSIGDDYKDITILYRVHSQSQEVEDHFIMNNIPYISFNESNFFERREIKDVLTYLRIAANPELMEIEDLKRIANRPTRFVSTYALNKLDDISFDTSEDLWKLLAHCHSLNIDYKMKMAFERIYNDLYRLVVMHKQGCNPEELTKYILEDMGYEKWALEEKRVKMPDVDVSLNFDALLDSIKKFKDVRELVAFIKDVEAKQKARKGDKNGNYIKLMSIHASKGKEFKNVIILGVCDRLYPLYKAQQQGHS